MPAQSEVTGVSTSNRRRLFQRCRCGGSSRKDKSRQCITMPSDSPIEKPDLAIYSQKEELAAGNVPNWDSPDIVTNNWSPFRLKPEADVTIRNLSQTVPAINSLVNYFISPFGIGTRKELKLSKSVTVPAGAEVEIKFPLDQLTLKGDPRVGVHILIEHPHDPRSVNNEGSQVHDGGFTTESGRSFVVRIPVLNDSNFTRAIQLSLMPTDIIASISPSSHVYAPFEQITATLNIEVPNFLHGTPASYASRAVTVVGRLPGGELIGGATRLLRIDD